MVRIKKNAIQIFATANMFYDEKNLFKSVCDALKGLGSSCKIRRCCVFCCFNVPTFSLNYACTVYVYYTVCSPHSSRPIRQDHPRFVKGTVSPSNNCTEIQSYSFTFFYERIQRKKLEKSLCSER